MASEFEIKQYKRKTLPSPSQIKPNSIYWIKSDIDTEIKGYITDQNGVPFNLKDALSGGVNTVTNSDGTITVSGLSNVDIKISASVMAIINSAVQPSDLGAVAFSNDYNDLDNLPIISNGITNLTYTASPTQGQVNSDTGTDAIVPLATSTDAGLFSSAEKIKLATITGVNSGDQASIVGISGTKSEFNAALTDGNFLFVGDITQYTDELAQDAVGNILTDSATINFGYNDLTNQITADVQANSITATELDNNINISEFINDANYADVSYVDSKIVNTLLDGDTTHAPSSDAVHDYYAEDIQLLRDEASTGLTEFGGLSIGTPTSTFSVGAVKGWFIDSTTNPALPTKVYASFAAQSNIVLTNLATQNVTYVGIDSSGLIVQSSSPLVPPQHRDIIRLGVIVHSSRVVVNAVNNQPNSSLNIGGQLNDLIESLGLFNLSGNIVSTNGANLNINKSAGTLFKAGSNFINDPKNPHVLSLSSLTAPSNIRYRLKDGTEFANTAVIDPNNYDINQTSILTPVPDTKYTVQRAFLFQSNLIRFQYDREYYDSMDDARAHIHNHRFDIESNLAENGLMICALIVRKGCTDLTNTEQALFVPIERFGRPSETNTGTGLFRKQILNNASSGLLSGGNISIASGTTINITAGKGIVVNNTTDPSLPTLIEVSWNAFTGQAITNIGSQMGTGLYINSDGTLFQDNISNIPNGTFNRSKIFIGAVGHPSGSLTNVYAIPDAIINPVSGINDFAKSIGTFPISGNKVSKNVGALTLSKTAGLSFFLNANYQTDKTNPNNLTCASLSAPVLQYAKQNAFLGGLSSSINTSQYDNAGTLTAIPVNNFVTHRIWHQPSNNILFFQYSQYTYASFNDAKVGLDNEDFIVPVPLGFGAYVVAVIITRKGETNLDNPARSLIIPQNKFSGTGSGGGGVPTPTRTNGGNANYNILVSDNIIYTGTTFTAPRTWTLPSAATVTAGQEYIIDDELQTVTSVNTLTIAVQTGQKLNGVTNGTEIINSAGGWRRLISNGVDGWFFDAGIGRLGKTQTWAGVNTFNQAIVANSETASRVAIIDASKNIKSADTTIYPDLTELSYLKGVTNPVQTQIDTPQITITTAVSIDTTTTVSGLSQKGRNVLIDNGATAINYTVNATDGFATTIIKEGTSSITFVAGGGRTLVQMDGTAVLSGIAGSRAAISSKGTVDRLYITNY